MTKLDRKLPLGVSYPTIPPTEFANRLETIGKAFIETHEQNSSPESLNFWSTSIECENDGCGTVACHGGWLLKLLPQIPDSVMMETFTKFERQMMEPFRRGVIALVYFLGFANLKQGAPPNGACWDYRDCFSEFMGHHEDVWITKVIFRPNIAKVMFTGVGYKAFGFSEPDVCTLKDIGKHYLKVATRVREVFGEAWPE